MLRIGVVARNLVLARKALDVLAEIDQDATKERTTSSELIMSDDTHYIIIGGDSSYRGASFDQLIIFSDGLEHKDDTIDELSKTIEYIGETMRTKSFIPKAYQVMIYEF